MLLSSPPQEFNLEKMSTWGTSRAPAGLSSCSWDLDKISDYIWTNDGLSQSEIFASAKVSFCNLRSYKVRTKKESRCEVKVIIQDVSHCWLVAVFCRGTQKWRTELLKSISTTGVKVLSTFKDFDISLSYATFHYVLLLACSQMTNLSADFWLTKVKKYLII